MFTTTSLTTYLKKRCCTFPFSTNISLVGLPQIEFSGLFRHCRQHLELNTPCCGRVDKSRTLGNRETASLEMGPPVECGAAGRRGLLLGRQRQRGHRPILPDPAGTRGDDRQGKRESALGGPLIHRSRLQRLYPHQDQSRDTDPDVVAVGLVVNEAASGCGFGPGPRKGPAENQNSST